MRGLLQGQPYYAAGQHFQDIAGRRLADALSTLPPDAVRAAEERGRALPLWPAAEALLDEITVLGWAASLPDHAARP